MYKFAHLLGIKARASDEHEEDEKAGKAKGRHAEEEERDENAEDDENREDAEEQDGKKEGKKAKKAKKAKSEGDDDDPDAEEDKDDADADENEDVKKGRRAERKRCANIFGSKYAAGRPDMAAHLAFNTSLSVREAINTLSVMGLVTPSPAKSRLSLDERMRNEKQVRLGPDAQAPAAGSAEAAIAAATALYNRVKGKQ
ncbi:hypothetical protein [Xenorhabdus indica]|uniref:hypothetical protein n=1 Tax=Xenorhabdus indica TaxID=333964 RepID=UPI001656FFA3|nr:hypothetical protein [Xenorhabdus indica]MBC8946800.1 hypothetical protein [Xenorhabdus indica]